MKKYLKDTRGFISVDQVFAVLLLVITIIFIIGLLPTEPVDQTEETPVMQEVSKEVSEIWQTFGPILLLFILGSSLLIGGVFVVLFVLNYSEKRRLEKNREVTQPPIKKEPESVQSLDQVSMLLERMNQGTDESFLQRIQGIADLWKQVEPQLGNMPVDVHHLLTESLLVDVQKLLHLYAELDESGKQSYQKQVEIGLEKIENKIAAVLQSSQNQKARDMKKMLLVVEKRYT